MPRPGLGRVRKRALGVEGAATCRASKGRIRGPQRACWSPQISALGPQEKLGGGQRRLSSGDGGWL